MIDLSVNFCGLRFKNPLIAASGTFGYGLEFAKVYDLSLLGGISVKGLSLQPHGGNPMPRIRETPSGMLNAIGLANIGIEAFLRDKLPTLKKYDTHIIVNFWGKCEADYAEAAGILDNAPVDMLEANISCPNVKEGGISFSATPDTAFNLLKAVRGRVKNKPLIVKLSPNVTNIKDYALAVERAGVDGISAINTLLGMAIDVKTRKPYLANITGGLSGPAIRPVAVRAVYEICKAVKTPVIGIGGIVTAEDAAEFMLAGASLVQVGTANFIDHEAMPKILQGLVKYMTDNKIERIAELTGAALI